MISYCPICGKPVYFGKLFCLFFPCVVLAATMLSFSLDYNLVKIKCISCILCLMLIFMKSVVEKRFCHYFGYCIFSLQVRRSTKQLMIYVIPMH